MVAKKTAPVARKKKVREDQEISPWLFDGVPYDPEDAKNWAGFIYLLTHIPTGKMYVGKKSFKSKRKATKTAKRRTTVESDWQWYWSSSDLVKTMIKEGGKHEWRREILVLCSLDRDVGYCEVREQWKRDVLETKGEDGTRLYLNDNIQGKFFPGLYADWAERSDVAGSGRKLPRPLTC